MAPLTAKRSLARFGKSKRWIFLLSPSAPAPVPSERWEAKHGIVERYGTVGRTGRRTDGLSGSSNICFGRGSRSSAANSSSLARRSFVSDNEVAELCVALQLRIPAWRGVGLGWGGPCVCTGCLSIVGFLAFLVFIIISIGVEST